MSLTDQNKTNLHVRMSPQKTNKIERQRFIETNLHVRKSPPLTPLYFSSSVCTVQVNLTRNKCSKASKSHRKIYVSDKSTCVGWSTTWATATADMELPSALLCQVCEQNLADLNIFEYHIVSHLPTVGVSKAHSKVPSQVNALPKERHLSPVLLQPKVEDGVEVVQPAAMKSPKVWLIAHPLLPIGKPWPMYLQHHLGLGVRAF